MGSLLEGIFKEGLPGLEKSLDLTLRRNTAITSNIANAETPGYRAVDLSFGNELEKAFNENTSPVLKTDAKHLDVRSGSAAHLIPDLSGATKADGNNVDIDIQMGELAFNKQKYSLAANMVEKKFRLLLAAIKQTL